VSWDFVGIFIVDYSMYKFSIIQMMVDVCKPMQYCEWFGVTAYYILYSILIMNTVCNMLSQFPQYWTNKHHSWLLLLLLLLLLLNI